MKYVWVQKLRLVELCEDNQKSRKQYKGKRANNLKPTRVAHIDTREIKGRQKR